jgi:hypothetical protein
MSSSPTVGTVAPGRGLMPVNGRAPAPLPVSSPRSRPRRGTYGGRGASVPAYGGGEVRRDG